MGRLIMTKFETIEDKPPSLEYAQEFVGGSVEMLYLSDGSQLLFDEEGLFKKDPEPNPLASELANRQIVGNALHLKSKAVWT